MLLLGLTSPSPRLTEEDLDASPRQDHGEDSGGFVRQRSCPSVSVVGVNGSGYRVAYLRRSWTGGHGAPPLRLPAFIALSVSVSYDGNTE